MDRTAHPGPALEHAAALLRALAQPVRLAVVLELDAAHRCVHELVDILTAGDVVVTQPLVSQHLRVLRAAGIVATERRGQEVVYRLVHHEAAGLAAAALLRAVA